jgi:hypothetical protein
MISKSLILTGHRPPNGHNGFTLGGAPHVQARRRAWRHGTFNGALRGAARGRSEEERERDDTRARQSGRARNDLLVEKALTDRAAEKPQLRPLVALGEQKEPADFKGTTDEGELSGGAAVARWQRFKLEKSGCSGATRQRPRLHNRRGARWQLHAFWAAMVGDEAFQERERYRTAARHSFNALVVLHSGRAKHGTKHFATLNRFFRACNSATGHFFRIAHVTVSKNEARKEKGSHVVNFGQPLKDCDFVPLETVVRKYVFARDDDAGKGVCFAMLLKRPL